jgi:hypothetical protein
LGALLAVTVAVAACSGGDDASDSDDASGNDATACVPDDDGGTTEASTPEVRVETIEVPAGPGPAEHNEVRVIGHGPDDAENVLVLSPGTSAGAAYFTPLTLDIVDRLDGWQVWSGIPEEDLTLVDESDRLAHTDPMGVEMSQNPLVETLVPFLEAIG